MTTVIGQDTVYRDRHFKFGQCSSAMESTLPLGSLNKTILMDSEHITSQSQRCYMPVFNSLQMEYGIHPGILISENQMEATELRRFVHQMPIIKCTGGKESFGLEYKLSGTGNQITDTVHSITRNTTSRVSLTEKMASKELDRKHSLVERLEIEESYPPLLTLSSGHEFDNHRSVLWRMNNGNPADTRRTSVSKPSSSHCSVFSPTKTTSKGGLKMPHTSNYEFLLESDVFETVQNCNTIGTEERRLPQTCMDQKVVPAPAEQALKYSSTPSSTFTDIQESSLPSLEPYPLPEIPSLFQLEPLVLMQQDTADGSMTPMLKKHNRRKKQLNHSEQQKVARIMIGYTLAFFLLAIVTFYVVYFI